MMMTTDEAAAAADVVVCFKVFDCDRDGLLSVSELHQMLSAMLVVHQLNQSPAAHCMVCQLTYITCFSLSLLSFSTLPLGAHLLMLFQP